MAQGKEVNISEANVTCAIMEEPIAGAGQAVQVFKIDRIEVVA